MSGLSLKILLLATILFAFSGCGKTENSEFEKEQIFVSIPPYADFVKRLAGDNKVEVTVMIPPGSSPETYTVSPRQLQKLSNGGTYFLTGGNFEFEKKLIEKLSDRNKLNMLVTSEGIELVKGDPHIWLGVNETQKIVSNIANHLIELFPEDKEQIIDNERKFADTLSSICNEFRNRFEKMSKKHFLVFHSAWKYFSEDFGLKEISIEKEGKHPGALEIKNTISEAKNLGINTVFIEPQFNDEPALVVAKELGAKVENINPLPEKYIEELIETLKKIESSLK
ncbi:MAG: zinc ABC transporter substrate-binding protein [Melioribacteraceae bacterium]|nr:zinc ABC transporter substrate-binding protein [Melioribacteraceae bacterium]